MSDIPRGNPNEGWIECGDDEKEKKAMRVFPADAPALYTRLVRFPGERF